MYFNYVLDLSVFSRFHQYVCSEQTSVKILANPYTWRLLKVVCISLIYSTGSGKEIT